jgi:sortase A
VLLLFLAYQLWWTNLRAQSDESTARHQLEQQWAKPMPAVPAPVHLDPGQHFAMLHIPKLRLTVPIAEGTDAKEVLDHGLIGHVEGSAFPADPVGNTVLAGHRNTHGEPFRHLPRMTPGDSVAVETATAFYQYTIRGTIPQTSPNNVAVLRAVPAESPFTGPGRYLTLMTCTPDYTSWYRFIAFAQLTGVQEKQPSGHPRPLRLLPTPRVAQARQ